MALLMIQNFYKKCPLWSDKLTRTDESSLSHTKPKQLRKLYEPEKFPGAMVLPLFDELFGTDRKSVCAFGFEPNPLHTEQLATIEQSYLKMVCKQKSLELDASKVLQLGISFHMLY